MLVKILNQLDQWTRSGLRKLTAIRKRWFDPTEWYQWFIFALLIIFEPIFPCIGGDWLFGRDSRWVWRRMWKSDAQVEKEGQVRRARCCANGRDEWRAWARSRDLIQRKTKHPKTKLWARKIMHEICVPPKRLFARLRSSTGSSQGQSPFLIIPPEIRELIYVYCVEGWSSMYHKPAGCDNELPLPPHEPPIARVSKLIRQESLTIFYRTHRFPLVFHPQNGHSDPIFDPVDWYYFLGPEKLCMIRHLQLHLCAKQSIYLRILDPVKINIDLEPGKVSVDLVNDNWLFRRRPVPSGSTIEQSMSRQDKLPVNPIEERFLNDLINKAQAVAQRIGPTGFVSAHDIYKFVE